MLAFPDPRIEPLPSFLWPSFRSMSDDVADAMNDARRISEVALRAPAEQELRHLEQMRRSYRVVFGLGAAIAPVRAPRELERSDDEATRGPVSSFLGGAVYTIHRACGVDR